MRISVIGTGYLGATHAAGMAELGHEVVGVDVDPVKVWRLPRGDVPFSEPGLAELVSRHVRTGRLRFTTSVAEAAELADVHFLCVGTPQSAEGLAADLSAVFGVVERLVPLLTRSCLVVGKSTVPVGTAWRLARRAAALAPCGVEVGLAWNPEFLREGHAVHDTLRPDRLVLGVASTEAEKTLRRAYNEPIDNGAPVVVTDLATAEMSKMAANAFLATKISFVNAMAEMSERAGADVLALADVLGLDARIGRRFLDAGVGFGGGCLPKDVRSFVAQATELGASSAASLLRDVDAINLRTRQRVVSAAWEMCGGSVRGRRVGVLGAAFKPGSDDVRDSPALHVAARLHLQGAQVRVHDPAANANAEVVLPDVEYVDHAADALTDADLVLHLTEWPQFGELDPVALAEIVRRPVILDGRNRLDGARWRAAGWTYRGVGRGLPASADPVVGPLGEVVGRR